MKKQGKHQRQASARNRCKSGKGRVAAVDAAIGQVIKKFESALKGLERAQMDGDVVSTNRAAWNVCGVIDSGRERLEKLARTVTEDRQRRRVAAFLAQFQAASADIRSPDADIGGKLVALAEDAETKEVVEAGFAKGIADIFDLQEEGHGAG